MREHQPINLTQFNGLWARGNPEETPLDHFSDCNNLKYLGTATFTVRDGLGQSQDVAAPLSNILRFFNYPTQAGNTLLVLTEGGNIYHVINTTTIFGPILTIAAMTDFNCAIYGGRAYITPFTTEVQGAINQERGLQNEFLYVYLGTGLPAHRAGGTPPSSVSPVIVSNGIAGQMDAGTKIFGYVYQTDTGYQTAPGGLTAFACTANVSVSLTNILNSPDSFVVKKLIVASKSITNYNGDVNGYTLYLVPNAVIPNNATTVLNNISFFDADLTDDVSQLFNNFTNPPAGVGLAIYNAKLVLTTPYNNPSVSYVSLAGQPEAFDQVQGILQIPADGNYITNAAILLGSLYVYKRAKTFGYVDNGNSPASWQLNTVDNSLGCGVHGVGSVLDTSGSNVDALIIGTYKGLVLFNGIYVLPELSWKVKALWDTQDLLHSFRDIQILNDVVGQNIYCLLTDGSMLYGEYSNGFDPKNIRWSPWTFPVNVNCIALINVNDLILGTNQGI